MDRLYCRILINEALDLWNYKRHIVQIIGDTRCKGGCETNKVSFEYDYRLHLLREIIQGIMM